jgi:hypothetical protein
MASGGSFGVGFVGHPKNRHFELVCVAWMNSALRGTHSKKCV